jgi:hypothetical protein
MVYSSLSSRPVIRYSAPNAQRPPARPRKPPSQLSSPQFNEVRYLCGVTVSVPADIKDLEDRLDAADRDALALVDGLTEGQGAWRPAPGAWSVAECLDHLATANRVYVRAMAESAARARAEGRLRRGPARPGIVGRWFVRSLEPPVNPRFKGRAPRIIEPRTAPTLADAFAGFAASQDDVRSFLHAYADLDLARVRFRNPFIRGVRFSLVTGLHVIGAHERRHLWQAWRVRQAAEQAGG